MLKNINTFSTDTCSLLLLLRSDTLQLVTRHYKLFAPTQVIMELKKKDFDETTLKDISVIKIHNKHQSSFSSKLSETDKRVITLYEQKLCDAVLSDDKQVLLYCRNNNIPHFSCVSLYALMQYQNRLDKNIVESLIQKTGRLGRYSKSIIQQAMDLPDKWPAN